MPESSATSTMPESLQNLGMPESSKPLPPPGPPGRLDREAVFASREANIYYIASREAVLASREAVLASREANIYYIASREEC